MGFIFDIDEVDQSLSKLKRKHPEHAGRALQTEALEVQRMAQQKAPVDTGRLRASAFTESPRISGSEISVRTGFGTDYAAAVHEDPDQQNRKYLARALEERSAGIKKRLVDEIFRRLEAEI
jgi:hypothetical protein